MLYPIAIEKEIVNNQAVYGVIVPDLLGCVSVGNSYQDAFNNIKDAIALHLEYLTQDGDPIPTPKTIDDYINQADYQGMQWAVLDIDLTPYCTQNDDSEEKIHITLPRHILARIDQNAQARGESRSDYIAHLAVAS